MIRIDKHWERVPTSEMVSLLELYDRMTKHGGGRRLAFYALWDLILALDSLDAFTRAVDCGAWKCATDLSGNLLYQLRRFNEDFTRPSPPSRNRTKGVTP